MRLLKFRVWDSKKYHYPEATKEESNHYLQFGRGGFWLFNENSRMVTATEVGGICEQFTGLKDKNGTEIYEGDVIETYQGEYVEVKFCNGAFVWYDGEPLGFGIQIGEYGENPLIISEPTEDWCEIKGNIHQNPELL